MKDRKLFVTSVIFFVFYFLFVAAIFTPLKNIAMPIVTALVLVYFLSPMVKYLEKFKIPPIAATGVVYGGIIGIAVFCVIFAVPEIYDAVLKIWEILEGYFNVLLQNKERLISQGAEKAYLTAVNIAKAVTVVFVGAVSAFYTLSDGRDIKEKLKELVPVELKPYFKILLDDVKMCLDSFFKGQLLIAFLLFIIDTVFLYAIGVPYAPGLGAIAAVLDIIPYAGAFVGVAIIMVVTVISLPEKFLIVLIGLLVIQQIENNIISPKISQDTLKLHPSVTVIVLYIGAFGGFWGILLSVPLTSVFCRISKRLIQSII